MARYIKVLIHVNRTDQGELPWTITVELAGSVPISGGGLPRGSQKGGAEGFDLVKRGPGMSYTSLSVGQINCLRLLIGCEDPTLIAAELGVSATYVEDQLDGACERLGVRTRIEAALVAAKLGLIHGC